MFYVFTQETTETAPSEDQADYAETFSFSDSETVASSHDGRAGPDDSSSDVEHADSGKGIHSKHKGEVPLLFGLLHKRRRLNQILRYD